MNDTKPTAKAAKIVASGPPSMSEVVAAHVRVEATRVTLAHGRGRGGACAAAGVAPAPPRPRRGGHGHRAREHGDGGHEPRAVLLRLGQDARPELRHQRVLDLLLRLARVHPLLDERALA